jgi:dihydroflavonol-4-reductase
MRVFITGGNGFIGSIVVRELLASGHQAVCLLRRTSRIDRIDELPFERALGDVREPESLRAGMRGCDATIHLAAPGGWENDNPALLDAVIGGGTRNVLAAAAERVGHRVVVVSSTAAIDASDSPRVFDEGATFSVQDPSLVYAHAKHRAECIALEAAARGVPVVIVNPAEVYGPGDRALATAGNLIDFATAWPVLVCDGGTSIVHVEDVARGIIAALERGRPGERYILGGDNLSVRALADLVLSIRARRAAVITVPNGLGRFVARVGIACRVPLPFNPHVVPYATRYWFVDNAKARRELGVDFRGARETIEPTIRWLEAEGYL